MTFPFPTYTIDAPDAFDRGVQHGTAARDQVAVSIETYRRLFQDFVGIGWAEARTLGQSYAARIAAFDADLLEEIRGIASGSGFEMAEILALNARSEIGLGPRMIDGCTAIAAFGSATVDERTILGQNWDWRGSQRDAFVTLRVRRPGKPAITMLTEAGIVGKIGFNDRGLGVCLNAIVTDQLRPDGTPLHVVLRGILESRNLGEAVERVAGASIASAANFLVAQHGVGAIDIEATPFRIDVLLPEADVLLHTNHLQSARLAHVEDLAVNVLPDSYPRLGRARQLVERRHGRLDAEALKAILSDHANEPDGICRHEDEIGDPEGKRLQTVFSVVMDLQEQRLSVTDGPPCTSTYEELAPAVEHAGVDR
jgi:isopenicillin-N N-acyltransferase-like protein